MDSIPTWKEMRGLKNDEPFREFIGVEREMQSEIDDLRALLKSQAPRDSNAHASKEPLLAKILSLKYRLAHQRLFGADNLNSLRRTCMDTEDQIEKILRELKGQTDFLDEKEPHKTTQSWALVHWLQQHSKDALTIFSKDDLNRIVHEGQGLLVKMVSDPAGTKTPS